MRKSASNSKLWLLILLFALIAVVFIPSKENIYEWVFVYYMSYDNDLSSYGEVILRDLRNGLSNPEVAVVVQADFIDRKGMNRIGLY